MRRVTLTLQRDRWYSYRETWIEGRFWPTLAGVWALNPGRAVIIPDGTDSRPNRRKNR